MILDDFTISGGGMGNNSHDERSKIGFYFTFHSNIDVNVCFRVRHDVALMSCFPIEETIRATG